MPNVEKMSIALTPELAAAVRAAVANGEYVSSSEVVRKALRDCQLRRALHQKELEELQRLWQEGIEAAPAFWRICRRSRPKPDAALSRQALPNSRPPTTQGEDAGHLYRCQPGARLCCMKPYTLDLRQKFSTPTTTSMARNALRRRCSVSAARFSSSCCADGAQPERCIRGRMPVGANRTAMPPPWRWYARWSTSSPMRPWRNSVPSSRTGAAVPQRGDHVPRAPALGAAVKQKSLHATERATPRVAQARAAY
jgi:antitoxin ParD1/3/4